MSLKEIPSLTGDAGGHLTSTYLLADIEDSEKTWTRTP